MKLFRYLYVTPDRVDAVNRLLVHGWQPVRETPIAASAGAGATGVLVLFEREGEFAAHAGTTVDGLTPLSFLEDVALFRGLRPDELQKLVTLCEVKSFAAEQSVFQAGDPDRSLFVLLSGELQIVMPEPQLESAEIISLKTGDAFGESTFFSPAVHASSAVCVTDCRILQLSRARFDELLQAREGLAYQIALNAAELLGARLQETDQWLQALLRDEQSHRIAESWSRFRSRILGGGSSMSGGVFTV